MVYFRAIKRTCNICGHKGEYSIHEMPAVPEIQGREIICPICWEKFIKQHVGLMIADGN